MTSGLSLKLASEKQHTLEPILLEYTMQKVDEEYDYTCNT